MSVLDLIGNRRLRKIDILDELTLLKTIQTILNIVDITRIGSIENASITLQAIRNPMFMDGTTNGWKLSSTTSLEADDVYSYRIKFTVATSYIQQYVLGVNTDVSTRLLVLSKKPVGGDTFAYLVRYSDGTFTLGTVTMAVADQWYYTLVSLTAGKVIKEVAFYAENGGTCYFGGAFLVAASSPQVTVSSLPTVTLPANGTITHFSKTATGDHLTPAAGKALKVWGFFFNSNADITVELRFKTSGNVIGALAAKGSCGMNLISIKLPEGSVDEKIEVYLSGAGTAKGWTCTSEV